MFSTLDSLLGNSDINFACLLIVFIVILYNYTYLYTGKNKGTGYFILWLTITLYSVFYSPTVGDNFTSSTLYYSYQSGVNAAYLHFEPIYFRIMDLVPFGYIPYRFALWGFGSMLLVLYLKWRKFDIHISTIAILFFSLNLLYYQRAIIGYTLIYVALALLVDIHVQRKTILSISRNALLALSCIGLALPFHTTMIFYATLVVLSSLLPPKRNLVTAALVFVVVFSYAFSDLATIFLSNTSEETQATANYYLQNAKTGPGFNIFGLISLIIAKGPFYIMLAYSIWNIDSKTMNFNRYEQATLLNTFFLILIALVYSQISVTIQGKFYIASMLPWGLFLSSYYSRNKNNKAARLFVKTSFICFWCGLAISLISGSFIDKL